MTTDDIGEQIVGFLRALSRLPPYTGIVFHGLPEPVNLLEGRNTRGVTATSHDPRIATENFTTPVIAAVISRSGRDITAFSKHPHEREVVLPPGVRLRQIAGVRFDDWPPIVVLHQDAAWIDPDSGLPETREDIALEVVTRLSDAKAAPPVEITTPGKFTEALFLADD